MVKNTNKFNKNSITITTITRIILLCSLTKAEFQVSFYGSSTVGVENNLLRNLISVQNTVCTGYQFDQSLLFVAFWSN